MALVLLYVDVLGLLSVVAFGISGVSFVVVGAMRFAVCMCMCMCMFCVWLGIEWYVMVCVGMLC